MFLRKKSSAYGTAAITEYRSGELERKSVPIKGNEPLTF